MLADERFTIRSYRPGDEGAILELFGRCFHQPRSREHFDWKYRRNPYGNEHISLAFDGDRLVGHYAGYPVSFWMEERELVAHQIGDTMTDPSIRHIGRGPTSVLGRTAMHFYQNFCEGKVAFNYGFNVANIQKFSLRFLRSDRVEPVHYRARDRFHSLSRWRRWLPGYHLELLRDPGAEFDDLFARVASAYRFLIRRDATYLRWRYSQAPENTSFVVVIRKRTRLVGWSAFRIREDRLLWGDALFDPNDVDAVEVLLRHVMPSYPVSRVECWFPPRPRWFDDVLHRLQFIATPEPQDLSVMCVPFTFPEASAAMRESFYYSMGDSDLF